MSMVHGHVPWYYYYYMSMVHGATIFILGVHLICHHIFFRVLPWKLECLVIFHDAFFRAHAHDGRHSS